MSEYFAFAKIFLCLYCSLSVEGGHLNVELHILDGMNSYVSLIETFKILFHVCLYMLRLYLSLGRIQN